VSGRRQRPRARPNHQTSRGRPCQRSANSASEAPQTGATRGKGPSEYIPCAARAWCLPLSHEARGYPLWKGHEFVGFWEGVVRGESKIKMKIRIRKRIKRKIRIKSRSQGAPRIGSYSHPSPRAAHQAGGFAYTGQKS